ncbi:hypothetical protein O3G_MSEX015324 [Manduca sexta]|uniref:AAA+ ATPase domain-containing protein n=1 Tax=Manduca sexta TaxID=7130 RepID=A0A922A1M4_MANSE|nr:hypothetical protein O3G_MSEX015324 [Manduca sexta]
MYGCVYLVLFLCVNYACSEFATILLGSTMVAGVAGGWFNSIKENTYCRYAECCTDHYIPYDVDKLNQSLTEKMFGQPLVKELVNILTAHKKAVKKSTGFNEKALVISLHGWTGVGKNYAATMVADALYRNGMKSKYVKFFMGEKDFGCSNLDVKKKHLISILNETVEKCPKSLIIFDEIEKMCPTILDIIRPMLDHHQTVDGIDYRDSIFIFISNIGGLDIANNLLKLIEDGIKRNEVDFHDFEPIIRKRSYFEGGFKESTIITQHLIDHYVPFLPLEQHHVEMCALQIFRENGIEDPSAEMLSDAMSVITYGPTEDKAIFANSGCKRLTRKVPYVVEKFRPKEDL